MNLQRIARADRGDGIGELQAGLEKREFAVVLGSGRAEAVRREAERGDQLRLEYTLKGKIMYGLQRRGPRAGRIAQVGGSEAGLPFVAVNHLRLPVERAACAAEQRGDARQQAEAQRIVGPVAAGFVLIGSAGTVIQFGAVERVERHARRHLAPEQARTGKIRACREARNFAAVGQLREHGAVARQQDSGIDAERRERGGQGRTDIAQAASLHQRGALRGGEQDAQFAGFHGCGGSGGGHGFGALHRMNVRITRPMLAGLRLPGPGFASPACR